MPNVMTDNFQTIKTQNKTYYIFHDPTYSDLLRYASHIEEHIASCVFADGFERTWKVDIISGLTGEVFASRDTFGLWEFYC